MKRFKVTILPKAQRRLQRIDNYIAAEASPAVAKRFTNALARKCLSLERFPERGSPRDDLRQGMRTFVFRRTVTVAYAVLGNEVAVLDFFYRCEDVNRRFEER